VKPKEIFKNIDRNGQYFLGSQLMEVDDLVDALKTASMVNPLMQSVIIRADKRCLWDHVVAAIDACHQAGIHDIRPTTADE
jgi:biopolymer transport protein ExbD